MTIANSTRLKLFLAVVFFVIALVLSYFYASGNSQYARESPKGARIYCEDSLYSAVPHKVNYNTSPHNPKPILVQGTMPSLPQIIGDAPKVASEAGGLFQLLWAVVGVMLWLLISVVVPLSKNNGQVAVILDRVSTNTSETLNIVKSYDERMDRMACQMDELLKRAG